MLRYINTDITFQEVPDETTLCINITGCPCHCLGCHSPYLHEEAGVILDIEEVYSLIDLNNGITCVAFMGGDSEPSEVNRLAKGIKVDRPNLKTAWYSGRESISDKININNFDFIKIGPYDQNKGGLGSPITNQIFYRIGHNKEMINETYKFHNK